MSERLLDEPEWFEDGVSERCHEGDAKSLPEAYRLGWEDCRDEAESEHKARARIAEQEKQTAIASHLEGLHDRCPLNVQDGTWSVQDWLLEEADRIRPTGEQQ